MLFGMLDACTQVGRELLQDMGTPASKEYKAVNECFRKEDDGTVC